MRFSARGRGSSAVSPRRTVGQLTVQARRFLHTAGADGIRRASELCLLVLLGVALVVCCVTLLQPDDSEATAAQIAADVNALLSEKTIVQLSGNSVGGNSSNDLVSLLQKPTPLQRPVRIYVYDMPSKFTTMISDRSPVCAKGAFGTEIFIHQALLNSPYRTTNPAEADFFYVPVYAACVVYRNFEKFPVYRRLVADALHHIIYTYPFWNTTKGRDHVWAFVHDYGGCLSWYDNLESVYYKELRNSIFLSHLGDLTMGCFSSYKDIVIPPMSSNVQVYKYGRGGAGQNLTALPKTTLAYFRGTVRWYHTVDIPTLGIKRGYSTSYSRGIRLLLLKLYSHEPMFDIHEGSSKSYVEEVRRSVFCLCPRGFAPWSQRLYDSVMLGCIPVIIADDIVLPWEDVIDYSKFSIKVKEKDIYSLKQILLDVPADVIREKQEAMKQIYRVFSYQRPSEEGDAFHQMIRQLSSKVSKKPVGPNSWV